MEKIILNVPFDEKSKAKDMGAKWDQNIKHWCISSQHKYEDFQAWLPKHDAKTDFIIQGPIFLLCSYQQCWKCNSTVTCYCLATTQVDLPQEDKCKKGFYLLNTISTMPAVIFTALLKAAPSFYFDQTAKMKTPHFLNHCSCNANLSEYILHKRRGSAFSPRDEKHAEQIKIERLIEKGSFQIDCLYQQKGLITKYFKKTFPKNMQ